MKPSLRPCSCRSYLQQFSPIWKNTKLILVSSTWHYEVMAQACAIWIGVMFPLFCKICQLHKTDNGDYTLLSKEMSLTLLLHLCLVSHFQIITQLKNLINKVVVIFRGRDCISKNNSKICRRIRSRMWCWKPINWGSLNSLFKIFLSLKYK